MADGSSSPGGEAYCLDELRRGDRDRYLILLFAPRKFRPVLAALYVFNLECARGVMAGGEQPLLGQMRLQWWRDGLQAGDEAFTHPVLSLLAGRRDLQPGLLDLLAARERDLTDPPFANLAEVVVQAQATGGALAALAAQALGDGNLDAARAAGTAYALAGVLRAIPFQAPGRGFQGRLCLPDDIWSGQQRAAVSDCVGQIAAVSAREVEKLADLDRASSSLSPLLHGSLARAYLRRLETAGNDPFAPDLGLNPLARPLLLCWRALLRRP